MMGLDKEATDIWMFGRPRPDLTPEESFAESKRRRELIQENVGRRTAELVKRAPSLTEQAKKAGR